MKNAMVICLCGLMLLAVGCSASKAPKVAVSLPEKYNTPDGMVLGEDGNIYLSCPNYTFASNGISGTANPDTVCDTFTAGNCGSCSC